MAALRTFKNPGKSFFATFHFEPDDRRFLMLRAKRVQAREPLASARGQSWDHAPEEILSRDAQHGYDNQMAQGSDCLFSFPEQSPDPSTVSSVPRFAAKPAQSVGETAFRKSLVEAFQAVVFGTP